MFSFLRNMKLEKKINFLMVLFLAGFLIFGAFAYTGFSMVKVKGPIYKNIIEGKELNGDVMPPSEYIIESYLTVLQLTKETDNARIYELLKRSEILENDFYTRHEYWAYTLADENLRKALVEDAFKPALEFFQIRDSEFIPAIQKGDRARAEQLANGILKQKYEENRAKINEVVTMASARNAREEAAAQRYIDTITLILIGLGFIFTTGVLFMWYSINRRLKLLSQVSDILKHLSEGRGDLTGRIDVNTEGQIGDMARYFNRLMERMGGIVGHIYDTAQELSKSSANLLSVSTDMAGNSGQISQKMNYAGEIINEIGASTGTLADSIDRAGGNVNMVATAVEEMSGTIRNLASASEQTSTSVSQVGDLASHMSGSISTLSDSSRDVAFLVSNVATAVKEINISLNEINRNCERSIHITADASEKAADTNSIIAKLDNSSKQIEKIINVINDIADQTNMLALNAAIEAAGAGEAGKGFAVVANEVKELAKQTAEATDEIGQQIATMQLNMSDAVKAVGTITEVIDEINIITNTIAAAVTEQSASTGEILNAVVKSSERVNQITGEIGEIAANSQGAARSIMEASKGIKEIARSATEISTASNEAAQNIDRVSAMFRDVKKMSQEAAQRSQEIINNVVEVSSISADTASAADKTADYAKDLSIIAQKLELLVNQFKI